MTTGSPTPIKDALQSVAAIDAIQVQGWVRTRRDSKDFSFIELNDGSSLRNLQIIARNSLPNYADIQKLTTGASVRVNGALVASQGKGQKWELVADKIDDRRRRGRYLSAPEKRPHAGISARDRASAAALESFRLGFSCAQPARVRHSQIFPGTRFRLRPHADYYRERLRRGWRIVSRHDDRSEKSAAKRWRDRLRARFFCAPDIFDGQRPARSRGVRLRTRRRFTRLARLFARRIQTRHGTPASFG